MSECLAYLISNEKKTNLNHNETNIGRLSSNLISISDPTISKNHATIHMADNRFYLRDLGTVNGTYLNGNRLESNTKYPLKHKDTIQFGKHVHLYNFYQTQPKEQKQGKINLKDYCFELESQDQDGPSEISKKIPTKKEKETEALKIPNLTDYLQLSGSALSSNDSQLLTFKQSAAKAPQPITSVIRDKQLKPVKGKDSKISLNAVQDKFETHEIQKVKRQQQHRRNLFLARQQEIRKRQKEAKEVQQQHLRLQIQRVKQQELLLKQQIQLQERVERQQRQMHQQRQRLEQEMLKKQQQRRNRQLQQQQQLKVKQQKIRERLEFQKEQDIKKARAEQQMERTQSQAIMRDGYERKKRELQLEAQALAQQYQNIYRETIKKMRNDIQKQEQEVGRLDQSIQQLKTQNAQLQEKVNRVNQALQTAKKQLFNVSGRNKAFILYASELQSRIDSLKGQQKIQQGNTKLKQQISSSRKLLSIKAGQARALSEQTLKLRMNLTTQKNNGLAEKLETILQNHQAIQSGKLTYFQFLSEEKAMQKLWDSELTDNQDLADNNLALERQIQSLRKQLLGDIRDHSSRLTEQRIHMLKCLHYLPQDKKKAAKFLIEEMTTTEQETRQLMNASEQSHSKIHQLIIDTASKRKENQYLSELLFGADTSVHHFDNMKLEINQLMDKAALQKDEQRVWKRLKTAQQLQQLELKVYDQSRKLQHMKQKWKEGIHGRKIVTVQKNPIIFFGDMLAQKQTQNECYQNHIAALQRQSQALMVEIQQLQRRKQYLSGNLQTFKREQLQKVRESLA